MAFVKPINRTHFPYQAGLRQWLEDYAFEYVSKSTRDTFVHFQETSVVCHYIGAQPCMVLRFSIISQSGDPILTTSIGNIRPGSEDIGDCEQRMYSAFEMNVADSDCVKRINAARYHVYKMILCLNKTIGDMERGILSFGPLYSSYVKKLVPLLKEHFYKRIEMESGGGFFRTNLMSSLRGAPWGKEKCKRRTSASSTSTDAVCRCNACPCECILPASNVPLEYGTTIVGRRITAKELHQLDVRDAAYKSKLAEFDTDTKKQVSPVDDSDDAPCFRVINSDTRGARGYARIHIGDTTPSGFKGTLIKEATISEMCLDIRTAVRRLKRHGVMGVVLSGNMWTPQSKHSGSVLNNALPKAFDGMVVQVIASARYADSMAAKVRNHHCILEEPNTSALAAVCEDDKFEDTIDIAGPQLSVEFTPKPDSHMLQCAYEVAFPVDSMVDQQIKCTLFHENVKEFDMPELKVRAPVTETILARNPVDTPYMTPVISTHMEYKHPVSQQELLYSVYNRSYMPPKRVAAGCSIRLAQGLFDEFVGCLAREPKYLNVSDVDRSRYLQKRGQSAVTELKRLMEDLPLEPRRWFALVKGAAKPTLVDGKAHTYTPTQTIVCKDKLYNHKFGPVLTKIKNFVMGNLRPEYFIYSESDVPTFEKRLSRNLGRMTGQRLEIDMSKYDKSQGWVSLFFEMYVFAYFGMSQELIFEWFDSHWETRIKSMTGPTAYTIPAQRKSGDPWTYYGNTLFLMAVLKASLRKCCSIRGASMQLHYMMASGDDSLVWGNFHVNDRQLVCELLASDYNLDAKLIVSNTMYFCSRFMFVLENSVFLVPDPVKALIKIGRRDVIDRGHVEDIRISLLDHISSYKYIEVRNNVSQLVVSRYGMHMFEDVMEHLYAFTVSRQLFATLYADAANASECVIIVPFSAARFKTTKAVWHDTLIRKNMRSMDSIQRESYMRAIGGNVKRKVLITYDEKYVPQGFYILADMRDENFSFKLLKELVYEYSRK